MYPFRDSPLCSRAAEAERIGSVSRMLGPRPAQLGPAARSKAALSWEHEAQEGHTRCLVHWLLAIPSRQRVSFSGCSSPLCLAPSSCLLLGVTWDFLATRGDGCCDSRLRMSNRGSKRQVTRSGSGSTKAARLQPAASALLPNSPPIADFQCSSENTQVTPQGDSGTFQGSRRSRLLDIFSGSLLFLRTCMTGPGQTRKLRSQGESASPHPRSPFTP